MGVFGAAQSMGFAIGAAFGAVALDGLRAVTGLLAQSYSTIFFLEGALFLSAALLAWRALSAAERPLPLAINVPGE